MYFAMDMGTSHTRIWLCEGNRRIDGKKYPFGAKLGRLEGREALFDKLRTALWELLEVNRLSDADIECVITSGMAGSEFGLCDIPHTEVPADLYRIAEKLTVVNLSEITGIPFWFVPGLKLCHGEQVCDIMRGEETETFGVLSSLPENTPAVLLLPGTHNKIIRINEAGEISDFCSTFSGELLDMIVSKSILAGSVSHDFTISEIDVKRGMEYAEVNGINAAVFHVRVMEKNSTSHDVLSSFLYGAVLGQDIKLIHRYAQGSPVFVGGNDRLQTVYRLLLDGLYVTSLNRELADSATLRGLQQIYRIRKMRQMQQHVKETVEREKIISILRNPDRRSLIPAVQALYDGGIRLIEITFDRSGKISREEICGLISMLAKEFESRMFIGAGTVTDCEEVKLAFEAGASFIISPNCDPQIISLVKKLGLVSIPAAYTATEIASALNCGADYIKLFPADQVTKEYVKAITAPLSDAKLLAVGGVTAENARAFINNGFLGIGVGSNLYHKQLIRDGKLDALTELAKNFVEAVQGSCDA